MSDPHIVGLHYRLATNPQVVFNNPQPFERETASFSSDGAWHARHQLRPPGGRACPREGVRDPGGSLRQAGRACRPPPRAWQHRVHRRASAPARDWDWRG